MLDISVLTVNYNTADLVKECVDSVLAQRGVNFEMIVMDNASHDHSVEILKQYGDQIRFIPNQENVGFGKANNQGFLMSRGQYLFLLNPDAKLLTESDLLQAVDYMKANPDIGLAGTRIIDSDHQHVVTITDHYPRQKQTTLDFSQLPGKWATVLGASMVIRRDVFEKLGGFDEDFFLYAEETDLCLRVRKLGYKVDYNDQVTVAHVGSASIKKSPPEQVIRRKKHAKYLFYKKHYPLSDVIKIAKQDLFQARWHYWRLALKQKFLKFSPSDEKKYLRHKISCEIVTELLQSFA